MFPGVPRQAVLWTFRPTYISEVSFDKEIKLLGYDIVSNSGELSLRLYWQGLQTPAIPYHIFLHILNPQTSQLLGQADTELGSGVAPSNAWDKGQLVIQKVMLPSDAFQNVQEPVRLDLGLYSLATGTRASVTDAIGNAAGDHVEFVITELPEPR